MVIDMTKEDLESKIRKAEEYHRIAKSDIYNQYKNELCTFKKGSVITDGEQVGVVESTRISIYYSEPHVTYECELCKKDGTKRKTPVTVYISLEKAVAFIPKQCKSCKTSPCPMKDTDKDFIEAAGCAFKKDGE
jgi:hypothetical protein